MAHGGLLGPPYEAVLGLVRWADAYWPFVNGKALLQGCQLRDLWAPDFVDVLIELYTQDQMYEKEMAEHLQKVRGELLGRLNGYDSTSNEYGSSNDDFGTHSEEPLPYIPPTEETPDGFVGLDPPMQ